LNRSEGAPEKFSLKKTCPLSYKFVHFRRLKTKRGVRNLLLDCHVVVVVQKLCVGGDKRLDTATGIRVEKEGRKMGGNTDGR
jgi:hypothetical protein